MPETFAQYLEKTLKQSTAQGLHNPLVKMPMEHLRREPEAPLMTRHPGPLTRACGRGIKRFRLLQPAEFETIANGGSLFIGTMSDPISRNLYKNAQTRIREPGKHAAFVLTQQGSSWKSLLK